MDVKCSLCGKIDVLTKIHKDYQKFAKHAEQSVYVCELCKAKIKFQATKSQQDPRPI